MLSFLKKFTRPAEPTPPQVHVAVFGKHPGWNDHIDDINLATDSLVDFKQLLYIDGIRKNIDAGTWDKGEDHQSLPHFHHLWLSIDGESTIVGRMWPSRDGKGRSKYPMVACVECSRLPLEWALDQPLGELEQLERTCSATDSAEQVIAAAQESQSRLRQLLSQDPSQSQPAAGSDSMLARAVAVMPADCEPHALHRVLYQIERERAAADSSSTSRSQAMRPALHIRVPRNQSPLRQVIAVWAELLRQQWIMPENLHLFIPIDAPWLDLILGRPNSAVFSCLRATTTRIPLTTDIPYTLDEEFINKIDAQLSTNTVEN